MEMAEIEKLAELIEKSDNIVAFTGAGVSTESNIPDFRSSKGIYETIRKEYGEPPEVLLSHSFFEARPETFFDYLKKFLVFPQAQPNFAHIGLALLEKAGKVKGVVTQNIDGLHQKAGSGTVYELHGTLSKNYCVGCDKTYDFDFVLSAPGIPRCSCGGIVRPNVVLYEEPLDGNVINGAVRAISKADMLLVMGTSLVVYPAAGLISYFAGKNLVLINKTVTPYDSRAELAIKGAAGETLKEVCTLLGLIN
jgi:NAD-dependent deacetylase